MRTRAYVVAGCMMASLVVAGFVFGRTRHIPQSVTLNPYRVVQREDKVYDDGRIEPQLSLETFTAGDGTIRQIRNNLNPDGSSRGAVEQILSPTLGGILIYPRNNSYQKFHESTGPQPRLTAQQLMALEDYDRKEALPNGFIAYVRKGVSDVGSMYEHWYCPELGNVIVGRLERPAQADYRTVRRTISIEPSQEKDAQVDLTKYNRLGDLTVRPQ